MIFIFPLCGKSQGSGACTGDFCTIGVPHKASTADNPAKWMYAFKAGKALSRHILRGLE